MSWTLVAFLTLAGSSGSSVGIVFDNDFGTTTAEHPLPSEFSAGPTDAKTDANGVVEWVDDGHSGGGAVQITRTNTSHGFSLNLPTLELAEAERPRRFLLVAWIKRFGEPARVSAPRITLQAFDSEWTGACQTLRHTESNPYLARWSKEAWLLEELEGKRLVRLRWLIDAAKFGDGIAFDDIALYDVTGVPDDTVQQYLAHESEPLPSDWIDVLPPSDGNLLGNSSFELGLAHGWSVPPLLPEEQRAAVTSERAKHGQRSVALEIAEAREPSLVGRFVAVRPHQTHSLSVWCYAEQEGCVVTLQFENGYVPDHAGPHRVEARHEIPAGEWTRVHTTGVVQEGPANAYAIKISADGLSVGRVFIDAVQFEEGDPRPYAPRLPLEVAIVPVPVDGLFSWDEPIRYSIRAFNATEADIAANLRVTAADFWGRLVFGSPLDTQTWPPGLTDVPYGSAVPARGSLRYRVTRDEVVEDECTITIVPPVRYPGRNPDSRFGQHVKLEPWQLGVAKRLGAGWVRLHDVERILTWDGVEPEKGAYAWHDASVALAHEAGLEVLGVLGRVPGWMLEPPQATGAWVAPTDLDAWSGYVEATTAHYAGIVDTWEVWNEPYGHGFAGFSGESYAALCNAAYSAARSGNPNARVLGLCTWEGATEFNRAALDHGVRDACDAFSYHVYTSTGEDAYERTRRLWDQLELDAHPRPLWMTEGIGGYTHSWHSHVLPAVDDRYSRNPGAPSFTAEEAAIVSVKAMVNILAGGAEKVFYYWSPWEGAGSNQPSRYTWFEYSGQLKPHAAAYAVCAYLLKGSDSTGRSETDAGTVTCTFARNGETVAVIWQKEPSGPAWLPVPKGATAFDLMGNPLAITNDGLEIRNAPVYLLSAAEDVLGSHAD